MDKPFYLVMGLGKTGVSCAQYLFNKGHTFAVCDNRDNPPGLDHIHKLDPHIEIITGRFDDTLIQRADVVVLSPGIPLEEPALQHAKEIIGDIELFAREAKAPVIAITGTNGKSTVTALLGEMAQAAGVNAMVGGNIGLPALDLLDGTTPDCYILELSSFQLDLCESLHPKVATILNISEDHLDRHGSLQAYIKAKQRIYRGCEMAIYNKDDVNTKPVQAINQKCFNDTVMPDCDLKIPGRHNYLNALAALTISDCMHWPQDNVITALQNFKGLEHRCEYVLAHNQVNWYNDSKATNVGAAIAAIEGLSHSCKGQIIWLAGGTGKGADFSELKTVMPHVREAILFGESKLQLQKTLENTTDITLVDTLEQAIEQAKAAAQPHDCVLLAPACASFDMFNNFEHRGQCFKELVKRIVP